MGSQQALISVPLYVMSFSLAALQTFSLPFVFKESDYGVPWCSLLYVYSVCMGFIVTSLYNFDTIRKFLGHYFFHICTSYLEFSYTYDDHLTHDVDH